MSIDAVSLPWTPMTAGLARFLAPYAGVGIDQRIWVVHPVLGITIAVSAIWLFRRRTGVPATPARTAA